MKLGKRLRQGLVWGAIVAVALVVLPPLFANHLDAWSVAPGLAESDPRLITRCGPDAKVQLSRWFYSYGMSGDHTSAAFRGTVASATCRGDVKVSLERRSAEDWVLTALTVPD